MTTINLHDRAAIAESVRAACIDTAIQAYEDAGIRGLCDDGRWEHAVAAMRHLDLQSLRVLTRAVTDPTAPSPQLKERG